MRYRIQQLLPDGITWWDLCECESPDGVSAVILAILKNIVPPGKSLKIVPYDQSTGVSAPC